MLESRGDSIGSDVRVDRLEREEIERRPESALHATEPSPFAGAAVAWRNVKPHRRQRM